MSFEKKLIFFLAFFLLFSFPVTAKESSEKLLAEIQSIEAQIKTTEETANCIQSYGHRIRFAFRKLYTSTKNALLSRGDYQYTKCFVNDMDKIDTALSNMVSTFLKSSAACDGLKSDAFQQELAKLQIRLSTLHVEASDNPAYKEANCSEDPGYEAFNMSEQVKQQNIKEWEKHQQEIKKLQKTANPERKTEVPEIPPSGINEESQSRMERARSAGYDTNLFDLSTKETGSPNGYLQDLPRGDLRTNIHDGEDSSKGIEKASLEYTSEKKEELKSGSDALYQRAQGMRQSGEINSAFQKSYRGIQELLAQVSKFMQPLKDSFKEAFHSVNQTLPQATEDLKRKCNELLKLNRSQKVKQSPKGGC